MDDREMKNLEDLVGYLKRINEAYKSEVIDLYIIDLNKALEILHG